MISEDAVLTFAGASLRSVWALELLLTLKRDPTRLWHAKELIRELRGSQVVVAEALDNLHAAGLVVEEDSRHRYHAGPPQMDEIVAELQKIYATKPASVIRAIVTSPNKKLQILSDAFKIKQ